MNGMLKNSKTFIKKLSRREQKHRQLIKDRKCAKHGEFFFAEFLISNGEIRKSPVFVLSNANDANDDDVVICSCTTSPPRTNFDIPYKLKYNTYIRTNKIYTVHRDNLHFKIGIVDFSADKYKEIVTHIKFALDLH